MKRSHIKRIIQGSVISLASVTLISSAGGVAVATDNQDNSCGEGQRDNRASSQQRDSNKHDDGSDRRSWWQWWRNRHPEQPEPTEPRSCEERQADVDQQIADFKANATTYQSRLDTFYSYQKNYVAETGIEVENYEGLQANINQAQTNATNAVAAVAAPTLDCNQPESTDKQVMKAATKDAKDNLNHYRGTVLQLAWTIWREVRF